jgi:hypothetical protein
MEPPIYGKVRPIVRTDDDEHVEERQPLWSLVLRGIVVLWLAWVLVDSLRAARPRTIFAGIDLGIHEAGHLVFSGLGRFLMVAGGTILQLLAPTAAGIVFLRRHDRFAACFAAAWLGVNLVEVSVYMADARAQVLPLVTVGGGDAMHDWAYLFGRMGLLRHDTTIALLVRGAGFLVHAAAVVCGSWVIYRMWKAGPPKPSAF